MPGYQVKLDRVAVAGVDDLIIRSRLDRQQHSDPAGGARDLGISPASWPMFGLMWPSARHLAARLALRPVDPAERILELGSDLFYERDDAGALAGFIGRHAQTAAHRD